MDKGRAKFVLPTAYVLTVIIITIICVSSCGGWQEYQKLINDYPEQKYQNLEQEIENIIVENDGIYTERLSKDDINYVVTYREANSIEGVYEIQLIDGVKITATIGKDLSKKNLKIERQYQTPRDYKNGTIMVNVVSLLLFSVIIVLILAVLVEFVGIIKFLVKK